MRSENSHLTYARGELRQDACTKRSVDHASMQSMQMVRAPCTMRSKNPRSEFKLPLSTGSCAARAMLHE